VATFLASRSLDDELLDGPDLDAPALQANLREMALLNRLPGGVSASLAAVRQLLREGAASPSPLVLDAGTGYGDFARRMAAHAEVIAVDSSRDVLAVAARSLGGLPGVRLLQADVRDLPLPDAAVDVAHASLLVHHLDPASAVLALRELRRVARLGVVVNDLQRGLLPFLGTAAAIWALARSGVTRHDGILSARRAYTLGELDLLAAEAGLRPMRRSLRAWPRVTTVYAS